MFVIERMATDPISVTPETTLAEAQKVMEKYGFRHLPVVEGKDYLVGIVSDRDMRDAMPSDLLREDAYAQALEKVHQHCVKDIMTEKPLTISPFFTTQDTLMVMQQKKVGALPVVDENGYLKGILSTRDLLSSFVDVMGIGEPGSLLCILSEEKKGQMKKIIDIITSENVSFGSVLVARSWDKDKRAIFPYIFTNNVMNIKKRLIESGFELIDPMKWYIEQLKHKS